VPNWLLFEVARTLHGLAGSIDFVAAMETELAPWRVKIEVPAAAAEMTRGST